MNRPSFIFNFNNFNQDFKFFLKKLFFYLPVILIIIGVNYFIDPAHIFGKGIYEEKVAQYLLDGYNVDNVTLNYNDRLLQKYYVEGLTSPKDIIVLGSSRSLEIRSNFFPGKTFLNNSVFNASLKDYLAIYDMYRKKEILPSIVILELRPALLNKNDREHPNTKSIQDYYYYMLDIICSDNRSHPHNRYNYEKYLELISISYFQNALNNYSEMNLIIRPTKEINQDNICFMKLYDGTIWYSKKQRLRPQHKVNELASKVNLSRDFKMDEYRREILEAFIDLLLKDNVEIIFYLAPYHPNRYNILVSQENSISQFEKYYKSLAKKTGIKLIGSFNPDECFLTEKDFYDGTHPRENAVRKIFLQ